MLASVRANHLLLLDKLDFGAGVTYYTVSVGSWSQIGHVERFQVNVILEEFRRAVVR